MPKTPIPTSITVRNFFPLSLKKEEGSNLSEDDTPSDAQDGSPKSDSGALHRSSAADTLDPTTQSGDDGDDVDLHPSRLEHVISRKSRASSFMGNRSEHRVLANNHLRLDVVVSKSHRVPESETTICTLSTAKSMHPLWNHLNEQIMNKHLHQEEWKGMYPNLHARFIIQQNNSSPNSSKQLSRHDRILAQVPLHPSQLRILPPSATSTHASTETMNIPDSLPPNAILVHYDDGITRVLPSLWELLVRRRVVEDLADIPLATGSSGKGERFDERAFDALGESVDEKLERPRGVKEVGTSAKSGSIYDDKAFDLLGEDSAIDNDSGKSNPDEPENHPINSENGVDGSRSSPDRMGALAIGENQTIESSNKSKEVSADANGAMKHDALASSTSSSLPPVTSEQFLKEQRSKDLSRTKNEVIELRRLVRQEQQLLEREQMMMHQVHEKLKSDIVQIQKLQEETIQLMDGAGTERVNLFRTNFQLDTHRVHLLKNLQLIFGIKLALVDLPGTTTSSQPCQHQFTIVDIPLPDDIHHPAISDDQISTALGFTCHLMALLSKYMSVPLRYRLVCKFSRSAIIDEGGSRGGNLNNLQSKSTAAVYPLFRERGVVDREQLDCGLTLLSRNADKLLSARQVDFREEWNVLAKLYRLMNSIINGKEF